MSQDTPDAGGPIQPRAMPGPPVAMTVRVPLWHPLLVEPLAPHALLSSFVHPQDLLRWGLWGSPCCFDCTCTLTLIHNQIYSKLGCKSESKWWKPHGETKGTSALKLSTGVSLCWQGVVSLHNDAFIQMVVCVLGDRCALQLLVEVKC